MVDLISDSKAFCQNNWVACVDHLTSISGKTLSLDSLACSSQETILAPSSMINYSAIAIVKNPNSCIQTKHMA